MFSVKKIARFVIPAMTLGVVAAGGAAAQAAEPLTLKVYNADGPSFHVNSVVVSGKTEALVIDSGFTRADALRIAANVLDSGKTLKTIFISNADPDFYFGAETLKSLFPQAQVLTTPAVREKIQAKMAGKNCYRFYSRTMDLAIERRVRMEHDLRGAWDRGELSLVYQPIYRTRDRVLVGAEALLRWNHPEDGAVAPDAGGAS